MKRHLFVVTALIMLGASMVAAAPIAYEGFNYPVGDIANGATITGTGFSGNWFRLIAPSGDLGAVSSPGLTYPAMPITGNKLDVGHNRLVEVFDTASAFSAYADGSSNIGADGTTLYMGILINENAATLTGFNAFDLFKDGTGDTERRLTIDRWTGHGPDPTGASYWLSSWNGNTAAAPIITATIGTHLFVLKISFGASNADTVSVYVDPVITATPTEPGVPNATISLTDASFDRWGTSNFSSTTITVDELRAGAAYPDAVPEPSSLGLLFVGSVVLLRRRATR